MYSFFVAEIKKKLDELLLERGCDKSKTGAITCKCFKNDKDSEEDDDSEEEDEEEEVNNFISKQDYPILKFYMRGALLEIGAEVYLNK